VVLKEHLNQIVVVLLFTQNLVMLYMCQLLTWQLF